MLQQVGAKLLGDLPVALEEGELVVEASGLGDQLQPLSLDVELESRGFEKGRLLLEAQLAGPGQPLGEADRAELRTRPGLRRSQERGHASHRIGQGSDLRRSLRYGSGPRETGGDAGIAVQDVDQEIAQARLLDRLQEPAGYG